jgi:hypothetical protein
MTRADWFAVVLALTILPAVYVIGWRADTPASLARVTDAQQHTRTLRLDHDQIIHIHGKLGDSVLQIQAGKIRFIQSPCTTKFCIHSGWLKYNGDVMACLPNGVYVEVTGAASRFDSISF